MEAEIEKHIKGFFRNLLKDCEEKIDHATEQSSTEACRTLLNQSRDKIDSMRQEIDSLCEKKKEELSDFAYALMDQIKNLDGQRVIKPVQKKRKWLWFWTK